MRRTNIFVYECTIFLTLLCILFYCRIIFDFRPVVYPWICDTLFISSVRSSYSHPDLLATSDPAAPPHFSRSHPSSTLDFHFLSHYSYIKAIMLYKGNHWTRCAGFMDASWVRLGITNDDLGTSWALPGDNLGMTWG